MSAACKINIFSKVFHEQKLASEEEYRRIARMLNAESIDYIRFSGLNLLAQSGAVKTDPSSVIMGFIIGNDDVINEVIKKTLIADINKSHFYDILDRYLSKDASVLFKNMPTKMGKVGRRIWDAKTGVPTPEFITFNWPDWVDERGIS